MAKKSDSNSTVLIKVLFTQLPKVNERREGNKKNLCEQSRRNLDTMS